MKSYQLDKHPKDIQVVLEGGLIQSSTKPILVIDYDTDGADPEDLTKIIKDGKVIAEAFVHYVDY